MNLSYAENIIPWRQLFVGREFEISAIKQSISNKRGCLLSGRRGSGKTALIEYLRPKIEEDFPAGFFRLYGKERTAIENFLTKHPNGFADRAAIVIENDTPDSLTGSLHT